MSRIVIAARTRMGGNRRCIGGHDLGRAFRRVRLLDWLGDNWPDDSPFQVGEIWNVDYQDKISARPPHVEDVIVREYHHLGEVTDLRGLVLQHVRPWKGGPDALFDRTVRRTTWGATFIPVKGPIPRCSTGYWLPDRDLERQSVGERTRFVLNGQSDRRFTWVGEQAPPERIEAGALVRVSLSRRFSSETAPEGYYVQLSGVPG